ncbi:hypothetical protein DERF_001882 [Dermatophagoides farinae]|uniref:Uncharacterized protein n=1 Tax=Dermatophagoides farinae TaxID=6954 RepID=A0A922IBQ7_DERFA|nr:hypothetical protein DERF_001882 [Dermatophagoides farinae]
MDITTASKLSLKWVIKGAFNVMNGLHRAKNVRLVKSTLTLSALNKVKLTLTFSALNKEKSPLSDSNVYVDYSGFCNNNR